MLDRGRPVEVVRSSRLAPTVSLALHHLSAEVRDVRVLNRLIQMHLCLHVVVVRAPRTLVQSGHLDVLDLSLRHSGALSGEEFLLLIIDYAVLHFMRFGRRTLRFGKLLVHNVGLHLGVVVLATLILSDGHLVRGNLDAPTS